MHFDIWPDRSSFRLNGIFAFEYIEVYLASAITTIQSNHCPSKKIITTQKEMEMMKMQMWLVYSNPFLIYEDEKAHTNPVWTV